MNHNMWSWTNGQYENNKYKKKFRFSKVFWGLLLIIMAIFLVISKMGLITGVSVWSMFFTVVFGALLIHGVMKRSFSTIFFSIAFLCIIYDDQLGITELTPWTVLLAALLLSIGMEILFHKKGSYRKYVNFMNDDVVDSNYRDIGKGVHVSVNFNDDHDTYDKAYDNENEREFAGSEEKNEDTRSGHAYSSQGEKIFESNNFSTRSKYINPETFEKGMFENSFGNLNIFFENVATQKKEGYLNIDNSFGNIDIYIPSSWLVDMKAVDNFGAASNIKGHPDGSGSYLLHITGDNSFGSVNIIYQ